MPGRVFSRTPALIGVLALTGLVAACAAPPPPPPPAPAPAEAAPPPPPPPAAAAPAPQLATTASVHLRAGPSARSKIRATLARGTPVTESGPPRGNWQPVETPKGNGWIFNRYLAPSS